MRSCDFKTTEASTKAWFRTNKIIDQFLNILDLPKFREEVSKWTDYAKEKYGVDKGRLFNEEEDGARAVPNRVAFKAIDESRGIFYSLKDDNGIETPEIKKEQTEVERILTTPVDTPTQAPTPVPTPVVTEMKTTDKKKVVEKMKVILDALGVTVQIAELPRDLAAQADMLNRLIQFAEDSLTEDNLTEETMHFIVEILEQKNKPLFDKLMAEIWKYPTYTDVLNEYSKYPVYQKPDGTRDIYKLKKEAIAQLLTEKVLENQTIEDKGFLPAVWSTIKAWLRSFFLGLPTNTRSEFTLLADEILNTNFISKEDRQFLGEGRYYARKGNRVQRALGKSAGMFGTKNTLRMDFTNKTATDAYEYIKEIASEITRVTEMERNPDTGEMEEVEYYVTTSGKKQRITSMLKESTKDLYSNIDISERAEALRQAKMQKGTAIHKTIEDIYRRYIDPVTGLRRTSPELAPTNIEVTRAIYNRIEASVFQRLETYPEGTHFLLETAVVFEEKGLAGTVDFIAVVPTVNGSFVIDILDWKTTDISYVERGVKKTRFDISPFNQAYWRNQLELYKSALVFYGMPNFRYTRAIPIVTETTVTKIDKNKPMTVENSIIEITSIKIGDVDSSKIPVAEFYNVPVPTYGESTGDKELDKVVEKLWGIYERIQSTKYPDAEKFKKRKDLDDILSAIRELQVKRKASRFVNLFHSSFKRFSLLAKENLDFLDNLETNQKFLTEEQDAEVNRLISDLYDGIEFLSAFENFPQIIRDLYPESGLTAAENTIIQGIVNIGANSQKIKLELETSAINIVDKLGKLYDINKVSNLDTDKNWDGFRRFMSSILHREEKSIQLSARMINAMTYLGAQASKKYFDKATGEFVKVHAGAREWVKDNKTDMSTMYNMLFRREILSFDYKGVKYKKKKGLYYRDNTEVDATEFFETIRKDRKGIKVTEFGNAEDLIPIISSDFYELLRIKQKEFNNLYNEGLEKLADLNFKGRNRLILLQEAYAKEILPWLKDNFDLAKYDKDYKDALDAYKLSIKDLAFDPDPLVNASKKERFVDDWISAHDIYTSPKALSHNNWLLRVDESKWISDEYKTLQKSENKRVLDVYELFTSINERAFKAGMLDESFAPKRFVPLVEEETFMRSLKLNAREFKEGITVKNSLKASAVIGAGVLGSTVGAGFGVGLGLALAGKFIYSNLVERFKSAYVPEKPEGGFGAELDPITKKKRKQRKIAYKSVQDEDYISDALFHNYALWADHIIKFEVISNYEGRMQMAQLLENSKKSVLGTDAYGSLAYKVTPGKLLDYTKKAEPVKNTSTENDLDRIIDNYLYSNSLEYKPDFYRLGNALRDLATATFLGFKATSWGVNLVGAASSASLQKGQKFSDSDFEAGLARAFGLRNIASIGVGVGVGVAAGLAAPVLGGLVGVTAGVVATATLGEKLKNKLTPTEDERKISYMLTLINSRITSQYDKEAFADFKDTWLQKHSSGDFSYWGYRKGDHWIQDAMGVAILKNTMVIDGKFVNIPEMVKKKYDSQRYKEDLSKTGFRGALQVRQDRRNVELKIQKEINDLKNTESIFVKMKPKGDVYDIGIDINTIKGHAEFISLSNTIKSYSKSAIGNIDESDKSIAKMNWSMQFLFQFKNWMPRLYGSRLSEMEWDYERNEVTYGRYLAFGNALKGATLVTVTEFIKNLSPLLGFAGVGGFAVGAGLAYATRNTSKYSVDIQEAGRVNYHDKKLEWTKQGKSLSHFPTEAEFIDLYVNGVRNTLHAVQQWTRIIGAVAMIAGLAGDDKAWYWRILARMMFGINKELGGDKDPDQLINLIGGGQNIIPVIGYLIEVKKFIEDFGGEIVGETQATFGRGKSKKEGKLKMQKAHPYHRLMNITPIARELHFWALSSSEKYAEWSEVPQPKAQK